ncbi:Protein NUCLEAR FUSION DEFECTIVE 4 [Linum perenne]
MIKNTTTKSSAAPWLSLVGVIWLQAVIGTNTNFAAYSSQLKQYLSLSQFQLNDLAFASDAGKLFGWVSGLAADHLPLWLVLVIGSSLGFFSYGFQFLSLNGVASPPPSSALPPTWYRSYPIIFILNTVAGNSICWVNTVCYVVVSRSFPLDQQVAIGLTTSYQGLTTKIYAVVVNELFSSSSAAAVKSYLLLDSVFPLVVAGLALLLMVNHFSFTDNKSSSSKTGGQNRHRIEFMGLFVISTVTGACAVMSSLSSKVYDLFPHCGMVFTFGLLVAPLAIPGGVFVRKKMTYEVEYDQESSNSTGTGTGTEEGHEVLVLAKEEVGVKVMLQRTEFWLYVFVYFLGPTIGIVYLNNLGQISESRRCYDTTALVSLSSSFTFFGRLLPSFLDYFFSRSKYLPPRTAILVLLMAPITGSLFLLLNESHTALYISTAVIGICTGAITSIAVSVTSELFGSQNFAVNHNIVVANIPVGSFCFGYLAAQVYESETLPGQSKCMGMVCYHRTFVVWGQLSGFGVLLGFILYNRTKEFYSKRLIALNSFV